MDKLEFDDIIQGLKTREEKLAYIIQGLETGEIKPAYIIQGLEKKELNFSEDEIIKIIEQSDTFSSSRKFKYYICKTNRQLTY